MLPLRSTTPVMNSSASKEISPEPHSPKGAPPPITRIGRLEGVAVDPDFLDGPGVARIPSTTPAPSKAGPAEQAQVISQSRLPSTISPLVPTSMKRVSLSVSISPALTTPALMSAPT